MGIKEYEAYLDQLDEKLIFDTKNGIIRSLFDTPYTVQLSDCCTPDEIKFHANALSISLLNSPEASTSYLMRRFIRIASEYHELEYDFESFCRSMDIMKISEHARPEYEGRLCSTSQRTALFFNGQYCPTLLFERLSMFDDSYVKVSKRVTYHDTFQVLAKGIELIQTSNYLLISIEPVEQWLLSSGQSIDPFVEAHMRHGTRFVLSPCSWDGEEGHIHEALKYIFCGLRFRYEKRTKRT